MVDIADVRVAIAQTVTNAGLRCSAYRGQINPPCAMVDRGPMGDDDIHVVMDSGTQAHRFRVVTFLNPVATEAMQKQMDEFCSMSGPKSLKVALEDTSVWSTTVDYCRVTGVSGSDLVQLAGGDQGDYLVTVIDLEVMW